MCKNYFLSFTLVFLSLFATQANAQDTIRSLIISEFKAPHISKAYVELTNMGEDTVNLGDFSTRSVTGNKTHLIMENDTLKEDGTAASYRLPDVDLAPGASWTMMNVRDKLTGGWPFHVADYVSTADFVIHITDASKDFDETDLVVPEWEVWGFDSVDVVEEYMNLFGGNGLVLEYHMSDEDSVIVDAVNLSFSDDYSTFDDDKDDLAGIPDACWSQVFVRKSTITKGNTNWELGKGTSLDDSEWIPLPIYGNQSAFTTFGSHGDYTISMESDKMDINFSDTTIVIPWGNARRGDDIIDQMTIGDGMSWYYNYSPVSEDSATVVATTGDVLDVYAVGAERQKMSFKITVGDPDASMNKVFPVVAKNSLNTYAYSPFDVSDGVDGMDSISSVPFAERVDSLFKYLEKAPKASWEIVFVDGQDRVDLKYGDILKVTAEDGSIKEYLIAVEDYASSDVITLSAITWPDMPEYISGWISDTIPDFAASKLSYVITLPYGTEAVPALVATPTNMNASITQTRATSLTGGLDDRTTTFLVTSESDTLSNEYSIVFDVEKDPAKIQHYDGEPFFSAMVTLAYSFKGGIQIKNPRDTELDLSKYMIVTSHSTINAAEAIEACITTDPTEEDHKNRYAYSYVPGYAYTADTAAWLLEPGKLSLDPEIDPIVEPLGVFSIASNAGRNMFDDDHNVNKWFIYGTSSTIADNGFEADETLDGSTTNNICQIKRYNEAIFLFKILNDSIFDGTKQVGDPTDFQLVDMIGDATIDAVWPIAGTDIGSTWRGQIWKKSSCVTGSTVPGDGFGTTADSSDWVVSANYIGGASAAFAIMGSHDMDIVTIHLSTVASTVYLVSDGYSDSETIQGDLNSTTVEQFLANIIKSDTAQVLTVISGSTGEELSANEVVSGSDILKVVSANGENETQYTLINQALESDASLTVVDSSLGLVIDSEAETITGVTYGQLLKDVVAAVAASDLATMNVINDEGELVPLQILNNDTVFVDTEVGANIIFEVVAQDGVTIKNYKLIPESTSSDAFVISSIYDVDQENLIIKDIPYGVSTESFFNSIEAVKGATVTLLDKVELERTSGTVHLDDVVKVVSEDASVSKIYYLDFLTETEPDRAGDPGTFIYPTTASDLSMQVYPVPASDMMTIKLDNSNVDEFTFSLISITGVCVYQETVSGKTKNLNVNQFKSGVYIVSVSSNGLECKKLILIK